LDLGKIALQARNIGQIRQEKRNGRVIGVDVDHRLKALPFIHFRLCIVTLGERNVAPNVKTGILVDPIPLNFRHG
jgi:hypothetical protein